MLFGALDIAKVDRVVETGPQVTEDLGQNLEAKERSPTPLGRPTRKRGEANECGPLTALAWYLLELQGMSPLCNQRPELHFVRPVPRACVLLSPERPPNPRRIAQAARSAGPTSV